MHALRVSTNRLIKNDNTWRKLGLIQRDAKLKGYPLYLIIDEYDNFTKPEVFPSLLFYYGMLTIKEALGNQLILGIPNNNVRKQYYGFLMDDEN